MRHARPISAPLQGELMVGHDPELGTIVDPGFRRRQRFLTGRSVSHHALRAEQEHVAGHLSLRGRTLEPGILGGLEAFLLERDDGWRVRVSAGAALTAGGELVELAREVELALDEIPVRGLPISPSPGGVEPGTGLPALLAAGGAVSRVLVLVLRAASAELLLDERGASACDPSPEDAPFEDRQRIDAAVLALAPWPDSHGAPSLPGAKWRNRLAHAVFRLERERGERVPLGLAAEGVPLALLGIEPRDEGGTQRFVPQFLDRAAVRRAGGAPRDHRPLASAGRPALWRARIDQLSEEVDALRIARDPVSGDLADALRADLQYLPPVGLLPKEVIDLDGKSCRLFPRAVEVDVVPAPVDELEALARASASLSEIDLGAADRVRLVVPVPSRYYEPDLLETPEVDPVFERTIEELERDRSIWLRRELDLWERERDLHLAAKGAEAVALDQDAEPIASGELDKLIAEEVPRFAYELLPDLVEDRHAAALGTLPNDLGSLGIASVIGQHGLPAVIEELDHKIQRDRDHVSLGFVRAESDIYRIRQHVLGNGAATRLATSDVFGSIASGSNSRASGADLSSFAARLRTDVERGAGVPGGGSGGAGAGIGPAPGGGADLVARGAAIVDLRESASGRVLGRDIAEPLSLLGAQRTKSLFERFEPEALFKVSLASDAIAHAGSLKADVLKSLEGSELSFSEDLKPALRTNGNAPDVADEAGYFRAAVSAVELTLTALRGWEVRLREYERIRARCLRALAELEALLAEVEVEHLRITGELEETRHDLALARSLFAEEQRRVQELAERRAKILREQFEFLFFYRPRAVEADAPAAAARTLLPGIVEDPVPDCLDDASEAPPELERMLDVWKEVPVRWFPGVRALLSGLPRLSDVHGVVKIARVRAQAREAEPPAAFETRGAFGAQIAAIHAARYRAIAVERRAAQIVDIARITALGWQETVREAERVVSLGDLLDGAQGRPTVAARAAHHLHEILGVATCLSRAAHELSPAIRLAWAQRISVFDDPPDLRDLSRLPRFEEVAYLAQQELLQLVHWLFARVDPSNPDAVGLVNDLVRVALLLASHAPVGGVLGGHVPAPTPVRSGGLVQVVPTMRERVTIGMAARIFRGDLLLAEGRVEDLLADLVSVKVLAVTTPPGDPQPVLDAGARVHFSGAGSLPPDFLMAAGSHH